MRATHKRQQRQRWLSTKMPYPLRTSAQINGYLALVSFAYSRSDSGPVTLDRATVRALYEIGLQARREELSREKMLRDMAERDGEN